MQIFPEAQTHAPINGIPRSPTRGNGDLMEYYVKNPSPGALPDVYTPIHGQELIGIGDLIL